jgi:hypothetical protein
MSSKVPAGARRPVLLGSLLAALIAAAAGAAGPRFYPDDPIRRDNDTALDASGAQEIENGNYYDFVQNTFFNPGQRENIPAINVNTLGEVPDSSWFTNRIGARDMSIPEIVRGPDRFERLDITGWPIVQDKGTGLQPGFRVADPTGHIYQIEFDPPSNTEMATGAEVIGTAFYHAFGYNVVEVYVVDVDPARLPIAETATIRDAAGRRRRMTRVDIENILLRAGRNPDGTYRALASRFADGSPLGGFRYAGVRSDDPNDIFLHEHRRELRANRVFAAWLNHDDSRGLNSLDMLVEENGKKYVKHYMFDFGSIMGSGTIFAQVPRAGNEYIVDWKEGFRTLASLGLYIRPWLLVKYPDVPPSVGRFEADYFDAVDWKPEYPNPAFDNMQPEDAFWAARIVSRFTDEAIRAVVGKARYSSPEAADYITKTLIARRDKVVRAWLVGVNPVVDVELSSDGTLRFDNAAVRAAVAEPAARYMLQWSRFDNTADTHTAVGSEEAVTETTAKAPAELTRDAEYIAVRIRSIHPAHPVWARPVIAYFRREGGGWKTVGLDRVPAYRPAPSTSAR